MADNAPSGLCRACRAPRTDGDVVLDLGDVPAADAFPAPGDPLPDPLHALSMWLCPACGLAQLTCDDTTAEEPRAVEPQALRDQADEAVRLVHEWGPVRDLSTTVGQRSQNSGPGPHRPTVVEFGSPHGGSWLPLFEARGWTAGDGSAPADVVVDTFGLMHASDQQAAARERSDALTDDGVLLLLFHSLGAIVEHGQWSSLRHGHFGYYSATALAALLAGNGLTPVAAWHFSLYGGTVLLAARRNVGAEPSVVDLLRVESETGLTDRTVVRRLQEAADIESAALAEALDGSSHRGAWHAYGAASRAVAVLYRAGVTRKQLLAVADASPDKQGRAMPGTRIPIISPAELVAADPERVWLLLPDLLPEVSRALPELDGRWRSP